MPVPPSSLISSGSGVPAATAAGLPAALPDPRARRGVRHRSTVVVTAAVGAVAAGYRSDPAVAEGVAGLPPAPALALGIAPDRRASESMIRRLPPALAPALDPDLFTTAISGWLTAAPA